jgi:mRNA-degrading endonuclease toxin of MazEF toxin-antitoxin module
MLSEEYGEDKSHNSAIRYRGDLWLDIDHKVDLGSGTAEDVIERSISDIRAIQKYLIIIGVNIRSCELFLSGSKGFHLRIPLKIMGGIAFYTLPLIHKNMAKAFIVRTGASGIDLQMYNLERGHLIRVENKRRSKDGNFKVPITWEELDTLDAATYFSYVKAPRPSVILEPPELNQTLSTMLSEAHADVIQEEKSRSRTVTVSKHLETSSGVILPCIKKLCACEDLKVYERMNELLQEWQSELLDLKESLYQLGDVADTCQYNLYAAEALRLSMCISALQQVIIAEY